LAFKNLLGEKDIEEMTDDEIRAAVNDYYTRLVRFVFSRNWDLIQLELID